MYRHHVFQLFACAVLGICGCQTSNHASQSAGFVPDQHSYQPTYSAGNSQQVPTRYTSFPSSPTAPAQRSLQRPCGTFG